MSAHLQQGTQEWLDARIGKITGSRVGAILGLNPYATREDVLREMVREYHGAEREFKGNAATEWGNEHESAAIAKYEAQNGSLVVSTGFHAFDEMLGASPDGLVGSDGMVEVKCPYSQKIKPLSDQPHYAAQVQMELLCADREWCDFIVWTPSAMSVERVQRDRMWLVRHAKELEAFYNEYKTCISRPDLSAPHLEELVCEREDEDWQYAATIYTDAKQQLEQAKEYEAKCKKEMVALANGKKTHGFGVLVYPVAGKKTVRYQDALNKYAPDADLDEFTKVGAESWSIRIDK